MRPHGASPNREVAKYIESLLPGYRVAHGRSGSDVTDAGRKHGTHPFLWTPSGELVRDERGIPFTLPGSPGNHRWKHVVRTRLRRAGLIR